MCLSCYKHAIRYFIILCSGCHTEIVTLHFLTCHTHGLLNPPHFLTSYDTSYRCHLLPIYNSFVNLHILHFSFFSHGRGAYNFFCIPSGCFISPSPSKWPRRLNLESWPFICRQSHTKSQETSVTECAPLKT